MEELIAKIREVATMTAACDDEDFTVCDYASGNLDDAYELGTRHGAIIFARQLLDMLRKADAA
jgi:hypothetical protein